MGYHKDKLLRDTEAGECPECANQCELDEEGRSRCSECDITYEYKCATCGHPHNEEGLGGSCQNCFDNSVSKDD